MPDLFTIWCGDVGGTRVTLLGDSPAAQHGVMVLEWLARDQDVDMSLRAAWAVQNDEVVVSTVLEASPAVAVSPASIPRLKAIREAAAIALRLPIELRSPESG